MANSTRKKPVTGWQRTVVIRIDKMVYWLTRRWAWFFTMIAGIYVGLPMLAPFLMNAGITAPARFIYTAYSPMCHQMASRSFFIGGEQYAYPRQIAGADLTPIESYLPAIPEFANYSGRVEDITGFLAPARAFVGNAQMGYKMALCERDIAIYFFLFVGGALYALLHKRIQIPPLSIWAFILIGMGPIGLDGFTQLFGYMFANGSLLGRFFGIAGQAYPLRESTPMFRTLTGALFGFSLAWLAFPRIREGMEDTQKTLAVKLRRIGEL